MSKLIGAAVIGQSGGPSSVINASAYGAIKTALDSDVIPNVYGMCNGIVGLLLMFLMLIALFAFIRRRKQCPTYRLALALWLMNFSFQVTQGGSMFHTDLLYALTFCMLEEEYIA